MVGAQLYKIPKDGHARDLGQALDLGLVGRVEELVQEVHRREGSDADDLVGRHGYETKCRLASCWRQLFVEMFR